ncbi:hypothetical protein FHG87_007155 [Trinorchestia longiramus]|nr:hypothetical protein FHG87_007155 [Trinorchestia longiramus]
MDTLDQQNSIEADVLKTQGSESKSSDMKRDTSSVYNTAKGKSFVRIRSSDKVRGTTTNCSGNFTSLDKNSVKGLSFTTISKRIPPAAMSKDAVQPQGIQTPSPLTCSICNSPTLCSGHCHCCGSCSDFYDVNVFDVQSACGCEYALVVSGLRVIKLYLTTDPRSSLQTAGIPSYTLLTKLLRHALPFFAPLLQSDASKLLARLP